MEECWGCRLYIFNIITKTGLKSDITTSSVGKTERLGSAVIIAKQCILFLAQHRGRLAV
jgi:hypothetical protein